MYKSIIILAFISLLLGCNENKNMNPFLEEYSTPYKIPPFQDIKLEHYMPAFQEGMKEHLIEINQIVKNPEDSTFENTIVELERTGKTLD